MGIVILVGGIIALTAIPLSYFLASILLLSRRAVEYGSTIIPDDDLRIIERYQLALWLWPVLVAIGSWQICEYFELPLWEVGVSAVGWMLMLFGLSYGIEFVRDHRAYRANLQLSISIKRELEPLILQRWAQIGGVHGVPEIEIRAFRNRNGIQGSVILRIPPSVNLSDEIITTIVPVIPHYLKFRIETISTDSRTS